MALTTEEAAVNTAVDALIAAHEAMWDAASAGARKIFVPIRQMQVGQPHDQWANDAVTLQWDFGSQCHIDKVLATADRFAIEANGRPMFWKVTNVLGNLT